MAERRTMSMRGVEKDDVAQLVGLLATTANVSVRIDKNKQELSIRGDQGDVNEALELAEKQLAAKQNYSKNARQMNKDTLNAASGGENEIVKSLLTTEVRTAAMTMGLQHKTAMLPRERNFDVTVRGDGIEVGRPPIKIFIVEKNLLNANSRIIVNPRNQKLEGGIVSAHVEKAGGPDVVKACQELLKKNNGKPFQPGHICHTKAGKIEGFDNIIHTVSLGHEASNANTQMACLEQTVVNCLNYAEDKLEAGSIAMPGIYGGKAGHPEKSVAKAIYDGIIEFSKRGDRSFLQKIHLNDINAKMVEEWKKCFDLV